jgi:hypothetical protein
LATTSSAAANAIVSAEIAPLSNPGICLLRYFSRSELEAIWRLLGTVVG